MMEGFSLSKAMSTISKHVLQSLTVLESFLSVPPGVSQQRFDTKPTVLAMCTAVGPLDSNSFQVVQDIMSDCWSTSKRTIVIDNLFGLSDSVLQRPKTYLKDLLEVSKQYLCIFLHKAETASGIAYPRGSGTGSGRHFASSCFNFQSKPWF